MEYIRDNIKIKHLLLIALMVLIAVVCTTQNSYAAYGVPSITRAYSVKYNAGESNWKALNHVPGDKQRGADIKAYWHFKKAKVTLKKGGEYNFGKTISCDISSGVQAQRNVATALYSTNTSVVGTDLTHKKFIAKKAGTAYCYAQYEGLGLKSFDDRGVGKWCMIKITVSKDPAPAAAPAKPSFTNTSKVILKGKSFNLKINHAGSGTWTWSSSTKGVASRTKITGGRKIKGLKVGTATITAKKGKTKLKCKVKVVDPKLNYTKKTITVGEKFTLKVTGGYGNTTWKRSSNTVNSKKKTTCTSISTSYHKASQVIKGCNSSSYAAKYTAKNMGKTMVCYVTVEKKDPKHYRYYANTLYVGDGASASEKTTTVTLTNYKRTDSSTGENTYIKRSRTKNVVKLTAKAVGSGSFDYKDGDNVHTIVYVVKKKEKPVKATAISFTHNSRYEGFRKHWNRPINMFFAGEEIGCTITYDKEPGNGALTKVLFYQDGRKFHTLRDFDEKSYNKAKHQTRVWLWYREMNDWPCHKAHTIQLEFYFKNQDEPLVKSVRIKNSILEFGQNYR